MNKVTINSLALLLCVIALAVTGWAYSREKHAEDRLSLACNSYADLVHLVKPENLAGSEPIVIEIPDVNTDSGKNEMAKMKLQNSLNDACSTTYGPLPEFPALRY